MGPEATCIHGRWCGNRRLRVAATGAVRHPRVARSAAATRRRFHPELPAPGLVRPRVGEWTSAALECGQLVGDGAVGGLQRGRPLSRYVVVRDCVAGYRVVDE